MKELENLSIDDIILVNQNTWNQIKRCPYSIDQNTHRELLAIGILG